MEVMEHIASGGAGHVFMVKRLTDGKVLARKSPKRLGDTQIHEVDMLRRLSDCKQIVDIVKYDGRNIFMEYIPHTLAKLCTVFRFVFSLDDVCRIIHDVLSGLAALHAIGYSHGDVSLYNILVKLSEGDAAVECAKLCDLERAKMGGSMHGDFLYLRSAMRFGSTHTEALRGFYEELSKEDATATELLKHPLIAHLS